MNCFLVETVYLLFCWYHLEKSSHHWVSQELFLFDLKKLIYFNWRVITLQYCDGLAIHQHESAMGTHVSPPILKPPSSSLPILFLWVAPEQLLWVLWVSSLVLHVLNLHWSSVLHMVMYMFQYYSVKSSHPHLLPLLYDFFKKRKPTKSFIEKHTDAIKKEFLEKQNEVMICHYKRCH